MADITVDLRDLKRLVDLLFQTEVQRRAETIVVTRPGNSSPEAALLFAQLVHEAMPDARRAVELRYRRLLEALESGNDVAASLASFVH